LRHRNAGDLGGALVGEEGFDGGLVGQVEFGMGAGDGKRPANYIYPVPG
jgi:hypothetical protein